MLGQDDRRDGKSRATLLSCVLAAHSDGLIYFETMAGSPIMLSASLFSAAALISEYFVRSFLPLGFAFGVEALIVGEIADFPGACLHFGDDPCVEHIPVVRPGTDAGKHGCLDLGGGEAGQ